MTVNDYAVSRGDCEMIAIYYKKIFPDQDIPAYFASFRGEDYAQIVMALMLAGF